MPTGLTTTAAKRPAAFVESVERGGSAYTRPDVLFAVAPGTYRINPFTSIGYFPAAQEVTVAEGESVEVVIEPLAVGEITVTYAPSEHFLREPDRASVLPEEGQSILNGFMRPGVAKSSCLADTALKAIATRVTLILCTLT